MQAQGTAHNVDRVHDRLQVVQGLPLQQQGNMAGPCVRLS